MSWEGFEQFASVYGTIVSTLSLVIIVWFIFHILRNFGVLKFVTPGGVFDKIIMGGRAIGGNNPISRAIYGSRLSGGGYIYY